MMRKDILMKMGIFTVGAGVGMAVNNYYSLNKRKEDIIFKYMGKCTEIPKVMCRMDDEKGTKRYEALQDYLSKVTDAKSFSELKLVELEIEFLIENTMCELDMEAMAANETAAKVVKEEVVEKQVVVDEDDDDDFDGEDVTEGMVVGGEDPNREPVPVEPDIEELEQELAELEDDDDDDEPEESGDKTDGYQAICDKLELIDCDEKGYNTIQKFTEDLYSLEELDPKRYDEVINELVVDEGNIIEEDNDEAVLQHVTTVSEALEREYGFNKKKPKKAVYNFINR